MLCSGVRIWSRAYATTDNPFTHACRSNTAVFTGSLVVDVSLAAPAGLFEYVLDYPGSDAPPGAGTLVAGTTATITIPDTRRLWLRSGDGAAWSAWIFADYFGT